MARRSNLKLVSQDLDNENKSTKTVRKPRLRIDDLSTIDPLTENQRSFFEAYKRGDENIALHGVAGTGKTFVALYKALEQVLDKGNNYDKIIIVRSAVQSRDIGHLPGDVAEKLAIFQQPYQQICSSLFNRKDAWSLLEEVGTIEFISTSFIRGTTFDDAIIIVDEMQNMNFEEIDTVMTRVGNRTKIIWCGDYRQCDLRKGNDKSGILQFFEIAKYMKSFTRIEFEAQDIVRSDLVKEYILAKLKFEDKDER
jgi:phosphate starvation-inducible protein PhoH